jgi:hypothetical protein
LLFVTGRRANRELEAVVKFRYPLDESAPVPP